MGERWWRCGAAAGGGGRVYTEATSSLINNASSTNSNLVATGGTGTNRSGTDGTVKLIRPQVTSLVFTSGTLVIDTSMATITHSDGSFLAGSLWTRHIPIQMEQGIHTRFVFLLPMRLTWAPVFLSRYKVRMHFRCARNNGDFTLSTQLIANGTDGGDHNSDTIGKLGGYLGGGKSKNGSGPGRGANRQYSNEGTGGAYAKEGVKPNSTNVQWGNVNGDYHISDLLGGSGGGGSYRAGGSGGGGLNWLPMVPVRSN